ncbi:membrane hypothetical protein [Candidatus Sulfopaludibacter sp. SbA3]|nr:membrane hypothetical protein [Candidatus Sulfopaludibacter sp. SbA3]
MMPEIGTSLAASVVVKVTVTTAMALAGAWLARRRRAAERHALLAAAFGVLLVLPVASIVAPPVRIAVRDRAASPSLVGAIDATALFPAANGATPAKSAIPRPSRPSLAVLWIAAWLAGAAISLLPLLTGLWQVRALRRSGSPWPHGQLLADGLAPDAGIHRRVEVLLHDALPGPMTCGLLHPAIVLSPDAQTWGVEDLNRAIVHELEHVRRGDWVSQWFARAVCAVYWFHPLVWMAWRQFALEAERSCDDAVLGRSEATAYAEQLVGLARRLAMKSPLLAMANRADLSTRVGAVLDIRQRRGRAGALQVSLVCAAAALLILTLSPLRLIAQPQSASAPPEFDAVSVKLLERDVQGEDSTEHSDPKRLTMTGSVHRFVIRAYGISERQLSGEPDWCKANLYSIDAVTSAPASPKQMMVMLRGVLANRFGLKLRQESRDMPAYGLEVASGGPKFHELKPGESTRDESANPGTMVKTFTSVTALVNALNGLFGGRWTLDRLVVDRTNLTGRYKIRLETEFEAPSGDSGRLQFPNLFHDLQTKLGLKLVPDRIGMPYYVVEQASAPTPN